MNYYREPQGKQQHLLLYVVAMSPI